jgi:hypothetical protein
MRSERSDMRTTSASTLTASQRLRLAAGGVCAVLAVLSTVLPPDWLEASLRFDPDGGNGFVEALVATALAVAALVLVGGVVVARRRSRAESAPLQL